MAFMLDFKERILRHFSCFKIRILPVTLVFFVFLIGGAFISVSKPFLSLEPKWTLISHSLPLTQTWLKVWLI